jgi:hypothetical protein
MYTRPEQIEKQPAKEDYQPAGIDFVELLKDDSRTANTPTPGTADKNLPPFVADGAQTKAGETEESLTGFNPKKAASDSAGKVTNVSAEKVASASAEKQARGCDRDGASGRDSVDMLMDKLGISLSQKTDPELIKDILHNDMKLDDCPAVINLLGNKLSEPESMRPMLERIRESIISKHPAMHEIISTGLNENLIQSPTEAGHKLINRSLNHMVLLDAITRGMENDYHVMEEVRDHIRIKRKELGIRDDFFGSSYDMYKAFGSVFGPAKTKSVDLAIDKWLELRKKGDTNAIDLHLNRAIVDMNIAEAVLTDVYNGFPDNARAGIYLGLNQFSDISISGNERKVTFGYNQDWDSLYETWNMAFVTGNLSNPQILYPKLLIPEVIDAKPEDYLFNRALALFLSVNFQLFQKLEKKESVTMPNAREIARRWGEINLSYGRMLEKGGRLKK